MYSLRFWLSPLPHRHKLRSGRVLDNTTPLSITISPSLPLSTSALASSPTTPTMSFAPSLSPLSSTLTSNNVFFWSFLEPSVNFKERKFYLICIDQLCIHRYQTKGKTDILKMPTSISWKQPTYCQKKSFICMLTSALRALLSKTHKLLCPVSRRYNYLSYMFSY